eukprot:12426408-Karenia_brevis.AAC.1
MTPVEVPDGALGIPAEKCPGNVIALISCASATQVPLEKDDHPMGWPELRKWEWGPWGWE